MPASGDLHLGHRIAATCALEGANVRFGSKADICAAKPHVRFTPDSDRDSGLPQTVMSALPPKADMCSATRDVCYGPKADITELGFHQRLDFTSLIVVFVAPLPFHRSPFSSSPAKQLG
jgi:hypothetical protein